MLFRNLFSNKTKPVPDDGLVEKAARLDALGRDIVEAERALEQLKSELAVLEAAKAAAVSEVERPAKYIDHGYHMPINRRIYREAVIGAHSGCRISQLMLGLFHRFGAGTAPNVETGNRWIAKSAKAGLPQAREALDTLGIVPDTFDAGPINDTPDEPVEEVKERGPHFARSKHRLPNEDEILNGPIRDYVPSHEYRDRFDDWSLKQIKAYEKGVKRGVQCGRWALRYDRMDFSVRANGRASLPAIAKRFAGRHGFLHHQSVDGMDVSPYAEASVTPAERECFIEGVRRGIAKSLAKANQKDEDR